jgi:hypothetical protein
MIRIVPFIMAYFAWLAHSPVATVIIIAVGLIVNYTLIRDMLKRKSCE